LLSAFLEKARPEKSLANISKRDLDLTPRGFARFVDLLEAGEIAGNKHWDPMVNLLVFPPSHFTAILKAESLGSNWSNLIETLGIPTRRTLRADNPHPVDLMKQGKVTGASSRVREFYTPSVAKKVAQMYKEDFATFSYSEDSRDLLAS
jgi:hypothetical protein